MSDNSYGFPIFNRIHTQADLMDRMMARTGANPLIAIRRDGGASWYEARSRCIDCAADRLCRQWLDAGSCDERQEVPEFCANRTFINACRTTKERP
jgi:hypothetical protein